MTSQDVICNYAWKARGESLFRGLYGFAEQDKVNVVPYILLVIIYRARVVIARWRCHTHLGGMSHEGRPVTIFKALQECLCPRTTKHDPIIGIARSITRSVSSGNWRDRSALSSDGFEGLHKLTGVA